MTSNLKVKNRKKNTAFAKGNRIFYETSNMSYLINTILITFMLHYIFVLVFWS